MSTTMTIILFGLAVVLLLVFLKIRTSSGKAASHENDSDLPLGAAPVEDEQAEEAVAAPAASAQAEEAVAAPVASEPVEEVAASLVCDKCGAEMVKRRASKGQYAGQWFWVCKAFPECRGIVPIES